MAPTGEYTYSKYQAEETHPNFDPTWLEETSQGALNPDLVERIEALDPTAVRDQDGDQYHEFKKSILDQIIGDYTSQTLNLPLAPYFADKPFPAGNRWRVKYLPPALRESVQKNNLKMARDYFASLACATDNPLKKIAKKLARHLSAVGLHSGLNAKFLLDNPNGFSVHGSGRFRFDCVNFAELAASDLKDIGEITIRYMKMDSRMEADPSDVSVKAKITDQGLYSFYVPGGLTDAAGSGPVSHTTLLVSDTHNHYLIVSNETVRYLETPDIMQAVRKIYGEDFKNFTFEDRIYRNP